MRSFLAALLLTLGSLILSPTVVVAQDDGGPTCFSCVDAPEYGPFAQKCAPPTPTYPTGRYCGTYADPYGYQACALVMRCATASISPDGLTQPTIDSELRALFASVSFAGGAVSDPLSTGGTDHAIDCNGRIKTWRYAAAETRSIAVALQDLTL